MISVRGPSGDRQDRVHALEPQDSGTLAEGDRQQNRLRKGGHPPLSMRRLTTRFLTPVLRALLPAAPGPVGSRHHVTMAPDAGQRCLPSRWFLRGGGLRPGRPRPVRRTAQQGSLVGRFFEYSGTTHCSLSRP